MKDGFIKISAITPEVIVADPAANAERTAKAAEDAAAEGAALVVFPELGITGYTAGDLFLQEELLEASDKAVLALAELTGGLNAAIVVGAPLRCGGKLYNCAFVLNGGRVIAAYPKSNIPAYGEFYETRYFTPFDGVTREATLSNGKTVARFPMGYVVCRCARVREFSLACEICEDLWAPSSPAQKLAAGGANVILNLSASDEVIGKSDYCRALIKAQSGKLECVYVYCGAGSGESTTDAVYGGRKVIAESGRILKEGSALFDRAEKITTEVDVKKVAWERMRKNTFAASSLEEVSFDIKPEVTRLDNRYIPDTPFVPEDEEECGARCAGILAMQTEGLVTRIKRSGCKSLVVGISGGLDSALALIVACLAADEVWHGRENVLAVTMPCFGTTKRTKSNAVKLTNALGAALREVNIKKAVSGHFKDIAHGEQDHDTAYENAQARERTQVLMDIANMNGGLVVGTGDLSELALGWATYNGDHMSMYGVNAGVPKTLVRYLVRHFALTCGNKEVKDALISICETPISPELLPPEEGEIAQKTEDIVGPYELHDFVLYHVVRCGFSPAKIYRLALHAFTERTLGDGSKKYPALDKNAVYKWIDNFYRRFFAQQFKRSCLPDGPKIGSVTLSPRADWRMPSDATARAWREELKRAFEESGE